jgi:aspartate-semialdehyde dehydrogenase
LTGLDKNAYNDPMKAYRFKCWGNKLYCDYTINALNDDHAQQVMADAVNKGEVVFTDDGGFRNDKEIFITFEEINKNEPTRVSTEKVGVGASVGIASVAAEASNS